ncbi:MAG: WxcM-like domain-containing protein [Candidatus Micrarchaeota archaeon]
MNIPQTREIKHRDDGFLVELYSERDFGIGSRPAHSYLVSIKPGKTRAKHYHEHKKEQIFVVTGVVEVTLADTKTNKRSSVQLTNNGKNVPILEILPGIAHAIKNIGKEDAMLVVFSDSHDIEDTIKYAFED